MSVLPAARVGGARAEGRVSQLRTSLGVVEGAGGEAGDDGGEQVTQTLKVFRQPLLLDVAETGDSSPATAEQLAKINALPQVLRALTADDVLVRGMWLMNTLPMHNFLQFAPEVPALAAPMCIGKPVLRNHDTYTSDALPVGRIFDAHTVSRGEGDPWLAVDFFMLNNQSGREFADSIDGGLVAENSPTILYDSLRCSICGADDLRCEHAPGKDYDGRICTMVMSGLVDVLEASFAWAGMQRDTGFYLAAGHSIKATDTLELLEQRKQYDLDSWESRFARWWR